jgi:hypothetical protein
MLDIAFKEWAVICRALADGRQALILRKGGIAEDGGEFRPEHARFWLYPTWAHQQQSGVKPDARPLLAAAQADRPQAGTVRLTHFAEVDGVYDVRSPIDAMRLDDLHIWSDATVQARFEYRRPGLFVLPVRVYRAETPHELPETPEYAGCKSWVPLGVGLPTGAAVPAMSDEAFAAVRAELARRLRPIATV